MADADAKFPENAPGKFYVDDTCSACAVCADNAPNNFKLTDDEEHAFVMKQPENDEEMEACESAMEDCPEGSIGDDGE